MTTQKGPFPNNLSIFAGFYAFDTLASDVQSGSPKPAKVQHTMAVQRTVLVVDLNPTDRAKTVRLLEAAGYLVTATGNFDEAKHLISHATPDVLVTDLRLGPYNGLHLILRSKADHPAMASLVTSRFDDPVLQAEAERHQAAFVLRPIADEAFLDAIAQSLSGAAIIP